VLCSPSGRGDFLSMIEETMSTVYQISTFSALVEGVYSGSVCSSVLLEHGDFGFGTFGQSPIPALRGAKKSHACVIAAC